jgi:hypothetical protein
VGTVDEIVGDLRGRRDRWGISLGAALTAQKRKEQKAVDPADGPAEGAASAWPNWAGLLDSVLAKARGRVKKSAT